MSEFVKYFVLKRTNSRPTYGSMIEHLHRVKYQRQGCMCTEPDMKHCEYVWKTLGIDQRPPTKVIATPMVARSSREEEKPLDEAT
jgi:hypothetical protein